MQRTAEIGNTGYNLLPFRGQIARISNLKDTPYMVYLIITSSNLIQIFESYGVDRHR